MIVILEPLQDSIGLLLATALGGTLAILGSVLTQGASSRQQLIERRSIVYEKTLQHAWRLLQSAEGHQGTQPGFDAIARGLEELKARVLSEPEDEEWPSEKLARYQAALDKLTEQMESYKITRTLFEPPDSLAGAVRQLYLLRGSLALHITPLIDWQCRLLDQYYEMARPDLHGMRRETVQLSRLMSRELQWGSRHLIWRVSLRCYSVAHGWRIRRKLRKVRKK